MVVVDNSSDELLSFWQIHPNNAQTDVIGRKVYSNKMFYSKSVYYNNKQYFLIIVLQGVADANY